MSSTIYEHISRTGQLILRKIDFSKNRIANIISLISTIGLIGSFFLVVPIGTGPDSGAHSVMTYCANGSQGEMCEILDQSENIVYRKVKIATGVSGIGTCHGNNLEKNASCDEPWRSKGLTSFYFSKETFPTGSETLLYTEFMGNRRYALYFDGSKNFRLTLNNRVVDNYELTASSKIVECKWPCSSVLNEVDSTSEIPVITLIPNSTTRLFMVLYDNKVIMQHNDFENAPNVDSLSNKWVNPLLTQITSEKLFKRFQEKDNIKEEAFFTDNYNPPFIYKFLANFIADTPRDSLMNFRLVSFGFIVAALLLTFLLFYRSLLFTQFILAFVLSSSIYGFYIFTTNNTSSYSFIGCIMISALPLIFYEEGVRFSRFILVLYVLFAIFLSTGRVDGLFFSFAGFILMTLLRPPLRRYRAYSFLLTIILCTSFLFVYINFPAAKSIHMTNGLVESFKKITLNNVLEIPGLMLGLMGDRGPLNIWGLGNLDVPLPSIVPLACGIGICTFLTLAVLKLRLKSFAVLLSAIGIWFLPFALTLASYNVAPGGWMFARYGLSQYGIFMMILVVLTVSVISSAEANSKTFIRPIIFGVTSTLIAVFVCYFVLAAKYTNGILLDRKDSFLPAIKFLGEWVPTTAVHYREIDSSNGWSPYLIDNPHILLILVAFIIFTLISSLSFSLKHNQMISSNFSDSQSKIKIKNSKMRQK